MEGGEHGQAEDGELPMDMPKLDIPVNIGGGNALVPTARRRWRRHANNNGAIPMATFEPMMPCKAALAGLASGKVIGGVPPSPSAVP